MYGSPTKGQGWMYFTGDFSKVNHVLAASYGVGSLAEVFTNYFVQGEKKVILASLPKQAAVGRRMV